MRPTSLAPIRRAAVALGLGIALLGLGSTAIAAEADTEELDEDGFALPPPPTLRSIDRLPASYAWDLALTPSFGTMAHFGEGEAPMPGFGFRGGWGRVWGPHRLGFNVHVALEGPVSILWSNVVEPSIAYDLALPKGFWFGASIGPGLFVNSELSPARGYDHEVSFVPHAALRIGYTDTFSANFRRFFVGVEPKVRLINGIPSAVAAIVIGSGGGY